MITLKILMDVVGNFNSLERWLTSSAEKDAKNVVDTVVDTMVTELIRSTPVDTGLTADSWKTVKMTTKSGYEVEVTNGNGAVVILSNYGHGTRNGGWVAPTRFVTKVTKPALARLSSKLEEVL